MAPAVKPNERLAQPLAESPFAVGTTVLMTQLLAFANLKVCSTHLDAIYTDDDTHPAQVRQTEAKLQETEARLREGDPALPPPPPRADTLPRPKRVSDVTMAEIRDELGFDKSKWIDLRVRHHFLYLSTSTNILYKVLYS